MRTRTREFLNTGTSPWTPAYSFQFKHPATGSWTFPAHSDNTVMVWPVAFERDLARAVFTHRKSLDEARADLQRNDLVPATI